jgi:hypothetical protein
VLGLDVEVRVGELDQHSGFQLGGDERTPGGRLSQVEQVRQERGGLPFVAGEHDQPPADPAAPPVPAAAPVDEPDARLSAPP